MSGVLNKRQGRQSVLFDEPPYVKAAGNAAGKKEMEGPLGQLFDYCDEDPYFGQNTWEKAESFLQEKALETALLKARLRSEDIGYLVAGDLLGQLIATSFGVEKFEIPFFGVYGACSTMGESMSLAAMMIEGGYADTAAALSSSHFASAEKQFRYPLDYGCQRPASATWTVTGSGCVILSKEECLLNNMSRALGANPVKVMGMTTGKIVDYGIKDSMNMGACMAAAAANVIEANLKDLNREPDHYDRIVTGDLGYVGADILKDMLNEKGINLNNHMDCGIEIYDNVRQDTHSGGSGCGCSALVLTAYLLPKLALGEFKRILFIPTGALLSPVSFNEGNTVPAIAHGIMIERC